MALYLTSSVFFNLLLAITGIVYFTSMIYFLLCQVGKRNNICD